MLIKVLVLLYVEGMFLISFFRKKNHKCIRFYDKIKTMT